MYIINLPKEELFLENKNKFIILDMNNYIKMYKYFLSINNRELEQFDLKINGMQLNNKNTMFIDFTSISSYFNTVFVDSKIKDEFIKCKLENYEDRDKEQEKFTLMLNKILRDNYKELYEENFNIDLDKMIKQYLKIKIESIKDFFKILNYIIDKSNIKQYILLYSKEIVERFDIEKLIKNISNEKVIKIEICSNNSKIEKDNNITFINEVCYQVTGNELYDMIKNNYKLEDKDIEKYFFTALSKSEDDTMNEEIILKIKQICKDELKLISYNKFEL